MDEGRHTIRTVGDLIERLQGLNPELPLRLVQSLRGSSDDLELGFRVTFSPARPAEDL